MNKINKKWAYQSTLMVAVLSVFSYANAYDKIVVLTPDVGDVVVALGHKDKVVGKDDTNKNPMLATAKSVGVHRNLTAEPIVAMKPDLVVGSHMALPSSIYKRLTSLKVHAVNVAPDESLKTYAKSIRTLGELLGEQTKANTLASTWEAGMKPMPASKKRYILSYDGRIVAGRGTVGDTLIKLAGGINAANVTGLKPLSREGWLAAKPDVIILAKHQEQVLGSVQTLKSRPEFAPSAAAKNDKIFYWPANDFLRYGLDSPQVIQKMNDIAK